MFASWRVGTTIRAPCWWESGKGHSLTSVSSPADASRSPVSFQARRLTQPAWPLSTGSAKSLRTVDSFQARAS